MSTVYILREMDYYDNDSTVAGITTNKEFGNFWDSQTMCFTEEAELDDSFLLERLERKGFKEWKSKMEQRKKRGKRK